MTIGKSPCARGAAGEECRKHIQVVAMSCTSGKWPHFPNRPIVHCCKIYHTYYDNIYQEKKDNLNIHLKLYINKKWYLKKINMHINARI